MRVIVTAALAALMLPGCAVNWPIEVSEPRFSWSANTNSQAADPKTEERALRNR